MKKLIGMVAIGLMLSGLSGMANASPFGLEMGTPLSELQKKMDLTETGDGVYTTKSVPNTHPDFDFYLLSITPEHGLCKVTGAGKVIQDSGYGSEIIRAFENIEMSLNKKYGEATSRFDFLKYGSIWKEPRDWMRALHKKERSLSAYWDSDKLNLPDSIRAISLNAKAMRYDQGYITINYEFTNFGGCAELVKSRKNSAL